MMLQKLSDRLKKGKLGMKYIKPEMDIIYLNYEEIITTSITIGDEDTPVDSIDPDGPF